ncbi:DUF6923 family protein [Lysobacter sp. Hz 25]|uniref:DUF6923 family protein n=1 Tax=Lysobacter sp. Hz 25 TaxID=3383698 RepID=UPI0038D4C1A1
MLLGGLAGTPAQAQFKVAQAFTNSTAPGWTILGTNNALTNNDSGILTGGYGLIADGNSTNDANGSGWLRLTTDQGTQIGNALFTGGTLPSSNGVIVEFDYVIWGGNGADGISFFLYDATQSMVGALPGAGLGYCDGLGGYLGIGLDEFGNFSGQAPGVAGGCSPLSGSPGGAGADNVVVRGPLSDNNRFISRTLLSGGIDVPTVTVRPAADRARIVLMPNGSGGYRVSVGVGQNGGAVTTVLSELNFPYTAPSNLRMGFGGATGGLNNIHEVRELTAAAPADIAVTKTVSATPLFRGQPMSYTVTIANTDINITDPGNQAPSIDAANAPDITDTLPASVTGATWTCSATAGSTCPAASGSGNLAFTGGYTLAPGGVLTFTISGTVAAAATCGASVPNTASANFSATDGFSDIDPTDNSATANFTVACADLAITKTNNQTIYGAGQSFSYVLVASNAGPASVTNAVFTDPAIANFAVASVTCASPVGGAVCPSVGAAPGQLSVANMQASGVNIPTLPSGGSVTFTISGTVAANATGNLTNIAQIALPNNGVDTAPANNTASDTDTPQPNFGVCDARLWLEQSPGAPTPTTLYQIGTSTNPLTFNPVGTTNLLYNAVGYNTGDNYQYGLVTSNTNTLVRIGADGTTVSLGAVSGLPVATYISGAFGTAANILYVKDNVAAGTTMYAINVATLTATPVTLSAAINIADWAWVGGLLYGVTNGGQLVSVNPATGAVTSIGPPNGLPAGFFGAIYGAPNGLFGSGNNPPSGFYQFDLATGAATLISGAPGSSSNDGSNCATANITFGADLALTKTNTPGVNGNVDQANDTYTPGTNVVYTIVVSNSGPFGAQNATVSDPLPAGITTASWTCSGSAGGVCAASGSGAINDATVDLPVGGSVTYLLTVTVPANFTGALSNTATVTAGTGTSEANTANNQATDSDTSVSRLTISKISLGGVGAFNFTGTNGVVAQTLTTTVAGTPVSGVIQTLTTVGVATTITEAAVAGYAVTDITCTGLASGGTATADLANRNVVLDAAATAAGANITCTFTNSRQPILRLQKALPLGRFVATDQFVLTIGGTGGPSTVTTTGSTNTPTEVAIINPATGGGAYTLSEAGAAATNLSSYTTTYACTNALAGGQTPSGSGISFNLTAAAGDDLTCTFSNTRAPLADLSITKTNTPGVNGDIDQANDTLVRGATTTYTIVVSNAGPDAVTGAVLRDPAAGRSNLTCTAPPTCVGAACPGTPLTLAALDAGVALGNLVNGGTVTVTLTCVVN